MTDLLANFPMMNDINENIWDIPKVSEIYIDIMDGSNTRGERFECVGENPPHITPRFLMKNLTTGDVNGYGPFDWKLAPKVDEDAIRGLKNTAEFLASDPASNVGLKRLWESVKRGMELRKND